MNVVVEVLMFMEERCWQLVVVAVFVVVALVLIVFSVSIRLIASKIN